MDALNKKEVTMKLVIQKYAVSYFVMTIDCFHWKILCWETNSTPPSYTRIYTKNSHFKMILMKHDGGITATYFVKPNKCMSYDNNDNTLL